MQRDVELPLLGQLALERLALVVEDSVPLRDFGEFDLQGALIQLEGTAFLLSRPPKHTLPPPVSQPTGAKSNSQSKEQAEHVKTHREINACRSKKQQRSKMTVWFIAARVDGIIIKCRFNKPA